MGLEATPPKPIEDRCRTERPKVKGQAVTDCNQSRLAALHMYTDDPIAIVVGAERAKRLLIAWHEVTREARVVMAGAEKR